MAITSEAVAKLAELSRLSIDAQQIETTTRSIGEILGMIETLCQVDCADVVPLSHPLDQAQRLRADQVTEFNQRELYQSIAPATDAGLYLVPRVIE